MNRSESMPGNPLSDESILNQFLESRLSHELNRFKSLRYYLSHELFQISLSGKALESKAQESSCQVNSKLNCPQKAHTKLEMNTINESRVDSNQDSEKFFE